MIDWTAFTWEAFATLITGLAAVLGAVFIGLRQVAISKAQTEIASQQINILARQLALEEMKLRADLFEKRFAVYEATLALLVSQINLKKRLQRWDPERIAFADAVSRSQFLFRPEVYRQLTEIWSYAEKAWALWEQLDTKGKTIRPRRELESEEMAVAVWTQGRFNTLVEVFGDELRVPSHP